MFDFVTTLQVAHCKVQIFDNVHWWVSLFYAGIFFLENLRQNIIKLASKQVLEKHQLEIHNDYLVSTNGGFNPKITANVEVSINGREYRQMVDPNLDLSEIPKFKTTYLWIRPFGKRWFNLHLQTHFGQFFIIKFFVSC